MPSEISTSVEKRLLCRRLVAPELQVADDQTAPRQMHTRRKMRMLFGLEPPSAAELTLRGALRVPPL